MIEQLIFTITALLGFLTLILIRFRFKSNRHINFYLLLFIFLSSVRFSIHSVSDVLPLQNFQKFIDLIFFITLWPLLYLYFTNLVNDNNQIKIKELAHVIVPSLVFLILFGIEQYVTTEALLMIGKILFLSAIVWNIAYAIASYKLLKNRVWKRYSDVVIINQQNKIIKRWTQILFSIFVLMFIRFLISVILIKNGLWYVAQNNYMWVGGLLWIGMYVKILYSPEFLYGYDVFKNKIKELKQQTIIFDNIWITKHNTEIINILDVKLKEKIALNIENYIIAIENLALNTNLFFSKNFKPTDLSHKLNIPKSHVLYLFKYHSKISFADFIKTIRIQKTVLLLNDGYLDSNTMESLAFETGFSSYSVFFKSFKSITGKSPQEYSNN